MDNTGFEITEKEKKHLIRYSLNKSDVLVKTELEMLKNNDIPGILNVSEIYDDGKVILLFNATSKIPFSKRLAGSFDAEQFYKLLVSICNIWNSLDEYMLNPKHFVLNQNYMFFDTAESEIYFIVMPIENITKSSLDIRKLFLYILQNVRYLDSGMRNFPQSIYSYLNANIRLDTKDFLEYIQTTYKSLKGILKPIQEIPDAPVHNTETKDVIDVEEVKQNVQSRFITQNEKIQELESAVNIVPTPQTSGGFIGASTGSFSVPTPKGAFKTPQPVKAKKEKKKKEKVEKKPKKEKKVKEKVVKEKAVAIPKPSGINVPTSNNVEQETNKKKKEKAEKTKGGLFSNLGFGKKKKENSEENNTPEAVASLEQKKDVIQPVGGINTARVPVPTQKVLQQGTQGFLQPQQQYMSQMGNSNIQQQYISQISNSNIQQQYVPQSGNNNVQLQSQQQYMPQSYNMQQPYKPQKFGDMEATIVVPDKNMDFDSTVALDSGQKFIENPALRNKKTGEVIKITKSEFLVGRRRIASGGTIKVQNERIPDASIDVKSISHEHALFTYYENKWHLKDEDSLNGTFINEKRLDKGENKELNQGDIIRFASEEYEYLIMN